MFFKFQNILYKKLRNYSATILSLFRFFLVYRYSVSGIIINFFILKKLIFICRLNQIFKTFRHSYIIFCRAFVVLNAILLRKILSLFLAYLSFRNIDLIANKNSRDVWICILLYWLNPVRDIFERSLISNIEWYYYSICFLIKWISNCNESLLSSSVPNFHWYLVSITFCIIFNSGIVQPNCHNVICWKFFFWILVNHWSFAYCAVSQYYQLYSFFIHYIYY